MSINTSLSGMKAAQAGLGVTAHNIANSQTNGFKKSSAVFSDLMATSAASDPRMQIGIGVAVDGVRQSFDGGSIEQTGASLDLAITGDGFFTTSSLAAGETLYTRNGGFELDAAGNVQDGKGNVLQIFAPGANPAVDAPIDAVIPITNGAGSEFAGVTVEVDGSMIASYVDGTSFSIGNVALASFAAPQGLLQEGSANWSATGVSGAPAYGLPNTGKNGGIMAGAIERSNVDLSEELVGLITTQQAFQANSKAIDTSSQIISTVINLRT
ncbi:flagellar hook-basal body complex protein [Croceicoccus gelatinilyticus]|uniref:flagellar hook-basal body complex protein n=1 Tax=Croceicoccus gelatinilyticus TaxID=2835536 RepID=UPI001BCD049C|nr:flagellar hook basal-body protein [Croceicoccus gelatinilyticus]MBS7671315.1 flagellar hook basal-body protein [Croceicoccus gelatinilyticus]